MDERANAQDARGITKSEISEFFADEWYVAVDGMEAVVNGEANAHRMAGGEDNARRPSGCLG